MTPSASDPRTAKGPGGVATLPPNGGNRPAGGPRDSGRGKREQSGNVGYRPGSNGGWEELGFTPSGFDAAAGFYNWVLGTGEVICDDQTYQLHGLEPDPVLRFEAFLGQVPPEDVADLLEMLDPLLARVGDYVFEYRVQLPDGRIRTLETRGRVIADPTTGGPSRMMGIIIDVTERRAAEIEALRRAAVAARMQEVTAGLASAGSLAELRTAVTAALPALGATGLLVTDAGQPAEVILEAGNLGMAAGRVRIGPDGPVRTAASTGDPLFFTEASELRRRFPQSVEAMRATGAVASAVIPIGGVPRMRGVCMIGFDSPRAFDAPERAFLVLAASAIGQAVHRARIHDIELALAMALQGGMLPRALRPGPGVELAHRYEAATTGIQVGGDWFDSVHCVDGTTLLIIGDVEGHNVQAAGMMYRLRTTLLAYAGQSSDVSALMQRANAFVCEVNEDAENPLFATCLIALIDPERRTLAVSRAGHIPPVLAIGAEKCSVHHNEPGVPLGVLEDYDFPVWTVPYHPGSMLMLCTDGLLESMDNNLDKGLGRCRAVLDGQREEKLDTVADELLAANRPDGPWKDDVALLVARLG
ncbi:SpoIIE family protein phosphatase [Actinospica sp.]|jgi:PAS domain S-box-containing protein|uniref:SpoIIE family protein phosphatase n=1 Tax=Actinospica sp. TaxID=1872142 RepID=UPI002B67A1E3|nr:SpoIIE family protein phosphatase [Actinospica sp.]HWG28217.1 SpoIIE family protein phosphatase [Actinospica sp.]